MPTKKPNPNKNGKLSEAMKGNRNSVGNKGGGRKTTYDPNCLKVVKHMCMLGATYEDLAKYFDVSAQTIVTWKKQFPDFAKVLRDAKDEADNKVIASLFERATGYKHKATKFFQHNGRIVSADFTEHYPPDVTAIQFWLKNRRPTQWRDKPLENDNETPPPASIAVTVVDAGVAEDVAESAEDESSEQS
jgi:hypothetical protein